MQNLQDLRNISGKRKFLSVTPTPDLEGTLFDGFENSVLWTPDASCSVSNEGTIKKSGTNSMKLTVTAGQSSGSATKTINQSFADMDTISFWVYIPTTAYFTAQWIILYLASQSNFSKYFSISLTAKLHTGWNKIIANKASFTTGNGESWNNTMVRMRFRVYADSSHEQIVYFDDLYTDDITRPRVIITFDDGWDDSYTEGFTYMQTKDLVGTSFLIADKVGDDNYATLAQLQEMYDAGWDLSGHGSVNLTTLADVAACEAEISANQEILISNGFTRNNCHLHYAYPNGGYNQNAIDALTNLGFLTARTIINRIQANILDERLLLTRQSIINTTSLATATNYIDTLILSGGVLILNFHLIVETPTVDTQCSRSVFQGLMDYIVTKRNARAIDCLPLTSWYNKVNV